MGAYVFLWPNPHPPTRDTNVKRLLSAACRRGIQADWESWRQHVLGIILTCPAPAYFIYTSSLRCRQKCWVVVVDVEQFKRLAGAIYLVYSCTGVAATERITNEHHIFCLWQIIALRPGL